MDWKEVATVSYVVTVVAILMFLAGSCIHEGNLTARGFEQRWDADGKDYQWRKVNEPIK